MDLDSNSADRAAAGPADEQFRLLVSSVADYAIFLLDPEGRVMSWNAGAERIKGHAAAEIVGRNFSVFYTEEERATGKPAQALAAARRDGHYHCEGWRVRRDGSRFWADATLTALREADGRLRGFAKVTRDMTSRRRLEEAQATLSALFYRAPGGIAVIDSDGRLVRVNPAFARMLGYEPDELRGRPLREMMLRPDEADSFERRYVRRDGGVVWARYEEAKLPGPDGAQDYVLVQLEDITARKLAADRLRESEQLQRAIFERAPGGMTLFDTSGRYLRANPAFQRLVGYTEEELRGRTIESISVPEEFPENRRLLAELMEGRRGHFTLEKRYVRKDGSQVWTRVSVSIVPGPDGKTRYLLSQIEDITERRQANEALKRSLDHYFTLLEDFPALIWRVDTAGRRDYLNRTWLQFTGRSLEAELGEGWSHGVHPDDAAARAQAFREAFAARRAFVLEYRLRRHDGEYRWVIEHARPIYGLDGTFSGYIGVCYDDSERRRAAERVRLLAQRQKTLAELSLMALGEPDVQRVLERGCEVAREVLDLELVRVLELQPAGDALKLVAGIGWRPGFLGRSIPIREKSLVGYTLYARELAPPADGLGRRPVIIEDLLSEERFSKSGMLQEHGAVSGMSVVIPGADAPYGVLGAHSRRRLRFEREDAEFLQALANVMSAAVQRQRAQQRVQESEARLQAFARYSPAVMFLKDADGRYRFVNEQFLQRFGLRRDQVLGRTDHEIFPAEEADAFAANDARVLAERRNLQFEEAARSLEGERTSIVSRFPILDAAGAMVALAGVASDITERKAAEQALREQRTLLSEAQKLAGLGCWEWEPATGRVTWSEELYRTYGVDPALYTPTFEGYLDFLHPEDRLRVAETLMRSLAEGAGFEHDERIVRNDGQVRYLRTHGETVRDERGRAVKLLGACYDVTEQKRAEVSLREAAQTLQALTRRLVEAQEAERRRIARELHDQVGQNLSALGINLDIALGALDGGARSGHLGRRIADSIELVDATLQTIESVMADLRPALLDDYGLGAALSGYADEFSRRTGIAVDVEEAGEASRHLTSEAAIALFRIAQEALNNVAKHARADRARVTLARHNGEVMLIVQDFGCGMEEPAARPKRWGMTTMRERAEAAGGSFSFESRAGEGSTVRASVSIAGRP